MVLKAVLIIWGVYAKALEQVDIPLIYYCLGHGGYGRQDRGRAGGGAWFAGGGQVLPEWLCHAQASYQYIQSKRHPKNPKMCEVLPDASQNIAQPDVETICPIVPPTATP